MGEVWLVSQHAYQFPGGPKTLTDGTFATATVRVFGWIGFQGRQLDATIDLGEPTRVQKISINFLRQVQSAIHPPSELELLVSDDGKTFRSIGTQEVADPLGPEKDTKPFTEKVVLDVPATEARYIRVQTKGVENFSAWYKPKGFPT